MLAADGQAGVRCSTGARGWWGSRRQRGSRANVGRRRGPFPVKWKPLEGSKPGWMTGTQEPKQGGCRGEEGLDRGALTGGGEKDGFRMFSWKNARRGRTD